jgi:pantoate--beta-alanine ligase
MSPQALTTKLMVVNEISLLRERILESRREGKTIGVVPTMGALHAGHLSLIETARREVDELVVTIFVNPTQFGPTEDFRDYPRPLEVDLAACQEMGVDVVFQPNVDQLYPAGFQSFVEVKGMSNVLEGAFRPTHFRGVTTIVLKLFNIVKPDIAYFGRKDYQQQLLIRRMCDDLNVPVEVRTCPTIREPDGLALSSRNVYLNEEERNSALLLSQCLQLAETMIAEGEVDLQTVRSAMANCLGKANDVTLDYATIVDALTLEELDRPAKNMVALVAARVGATRLIDNIPVASS